MPNTCDYTTHWLHGPSSLTECLLRLLPTLTTLAPCCCGLIHLMNTVWLTCSKSGSTKSMSLICLLNTYHKLICLIINVNKCVLNSQSIKYARTFRFSLSLSHLPLCKSSPLGPNPYSQVQVMKVAKATMWTCYIFLEYQLHYLVSSSKFLY